jgi:hypothetical protein
MNGIDIAASPDLHPPRELAGWPSLDRGTRLVFIVRDIPRMLITRTLTKFAAIDAERIRGARQGVATRHRQLAKV